MQDGNLFVLKENNFERITDSQNLQELYGAVLYTSYTQFFPMTNYIILI